MTERLCTSRSAGRCEPCAGSGRRHSIFDFCNCDPECVDLGQSEEQGVKAVVNPNMVIRPANLNDSRFIFNLAMDHSVRAMSTRDAVFEYSEHERWLAQKMSNGHNRIWIIEADGIPAGQVRYGLNVVAYAWTFTMGGKTTSGPGEYEAEIAISISPTFRGRGLAKELLLTTEPWARNWLKVSRLVALVLMGNNASMALFKSCGFTIVGEEQRMGKDHWRYEK